MRKYQDGVAALLVTCLLLAASLVIVLTSYRNVFYQIKRAQNEVTSRQQHWLAEGALECGWAQFKPIKSIPATVTDCDSGLAIVPSFEVTQAGYMVKADVGFASLKKEIQMGGDLGYGAMQSSADVYFRSSTTFSTPDPGALGTDGWECIALTYKSRFYSSSVDNKGVVHGESPFAGFSNPDGRDCANTAIKDHLSVGTGKDFLQNTHLKPFESFFGVEEADHDKVRDNGTFTILDAGGSGALLPSCGTQLTTQILSGNHHLWVEGSCEITQAEYSDLMDATQKTNGVTVMVHDGLFSVMSPPGKAATAKKFKGVLFHFNYAYTPSVGDWSGLAANAHLNHVPSVVEDSYRTIASYYQHGAFLVSGGQYFDSDGQAAVFFDSLDFRYNKDIIDNSRNANVVPRWRKGSWYAK